MMYKFYASVILCLSLSTLLYGKLSFHGFRRVCSNTSPQCLRDTVQAALPDFVHGFPQLGIKPLDPFVVEALNLTLPGGLNVEFTNGYAKGLKSCVIESLNNFGDTYDLEYRCNLTLKGKYRAIGHVLLFNVNSAGDSTISCKNVVTHWTFQLGTITRDDKDYFQINNFNSSLRYEGRVHYHMTNLMPGNPEMSRAILTFMNENWRSVAEEFGGPIVEFGVQAILHNVNKLFDMVPKYNLIQY